MTSYASSSADDNHQINSNQPLHYYKGKLKFISESEIYFVDQRNVAVVDIQNFFVNGQQATAEDLKTYRIKVPRQGYSETCEIHSYVEKSSSDVQTIDNLWLPGKKQWRAQLAWVGLMPGAVAKKIDLVYCMPLSYYTGYVKEVFGNRLLFGDSRNSVMVNTDSFYVKGERVSVISKDFDNILSMTDSTIHAYICKLHILTFPGYKGPDPYLPTWPKGDYTTDLWVAKYAWQGPTPPAVKEEVKRYYKLRLNEWSFLGCFPWMVRDLSKIAKSQGDGKLQFYTDDVLTSDLTYLPIIPMEQTPGIMKGSFLIGDHNQALMTSFADVIAFEKENFYIHGKKFKSQLSLSQFLQDRKLYLSAWVQPLRRPKCLFHINVAWYAPCVWIGVTPEELKPLQREDANKEFTGESLIENIETSSDMRLTHFLGTLSYLSHNNGDFKCRVNQIHAVSVSFKRKALYINGSKFSGSLLNWTATLESGLWSLLAYPVDAESHAPGILQFCAIAVWQYQFQVYMGVIPALISEAVDNSTHVENGHMFGWIVFVSEEFGIIKASCTQEKSVFMFFRKSVLYIDGKVWDDSYSLHEISSYQRCKMLARPVPEREVFGYTVTMEADMVWFGVKPMIDLKNVEAMEDEDESRLRPFCGTVETEKVLEAVDGVVLGVILMTNATQGLVVSSRSIITFSSHNMYINGEKFMKKYASLSDYCSGRQINVRVLAVPLKEAKVVCNCKVLCEAVCVWIGKEPSNLRTLKVQYTGKTEKQNILERERHTGKLSTTPGFFYMIGNIFTVGQTMGVLSCTTPLGFVNVAFWSKAVFINSAHLPENSKLLDHGTFRQPDWSCIAYPVAPTEYLSNMVMYCAVAVWQQSDHHKIGSELLHLLTFETQKHLPKEILIALQPTMEDKPCNKEVAEAHMKTHNGSGSINNNHEPDIVQKPEVCDETGLQKMYNKNEVPTQAFHGRHVCGYVIKKYKDGGIAQWKSVNHQGYVHIHFFSKVIYVDLKTLSRKYKLSAIEGRPCNFYVKPVPPYDVCGITCSLEATCGWIGKKPPEIPRPGEQELAYIILNDVFVTPFDNVSEDSDGVQELPLLSTMHKTIVVEDSNISERNSIIHDTVAQLESIQDLSQSLEKVTVSSVNRDIPQESVTETDLVVPEMVPPSSAAPIPPSIAVGTSSILDEGIWNFRSERDGHLRGTLVGVFTNLGRLKGEDDKEHFFPRDVCFLYGVPLGNVELWHVLFQGHKLLYTTIDKRPGSKVEKVWFGTLEMPDKKTTRWLLDEWCKDNAVLEDAYMILLQQLELM